MMSSLRNLYKKSKDRKSKDYNYVTRANTLASRLSRSYLISCSCTGLYFMLGPILKIITNKLRSVTYIRELPMPMKFPFNTENSPGYEIGFVYTAVFTTIVVVYASAIDGLFISFAINLRGHFQALQHDIRKAVYNDTKVDPQATIISLVDYHVELLSLSKQLRLIYMPIVFGQFLITSLQVGVIIYQMFTSFEIGVALQLSDWHLATPHQRRSLAFIMLRSQKKVVIKAGFYEASLANFLAV
ncbi:uncharacterized protein Dwil_GK11569 [Drosophila willistoni]|uniref:Odorant receptor n=1 Tax=Drosophila willistoni TaxID=7260 RepID=B4N900_DROWI|nr:odorant receptor 82a [Drosophila willistoni]EDW80505.2 uncharacterized protein Dwil_GK11569 [Drosophila willistoni]